MRIRFDQDALKEYLEAIVFYSNRDRKIGLRFADAVETGVTTIVSRPTRFRELEDGIRRYRVPRFPYSILYHVAADEILILCVKHDRRNPDYWRYRLDR
jgi:plasmid stabilization system protein ParE